MSKTQPEQLIVNSIIAWLRLKNVTCWQARNGGTYDPSKRIFRRPGRNHMPGIPDIVGYTSFGSPLYIEVKVPGKKPTEDQMNFLERAKKAGCIAIWADSLESARNQLVEILHR